MICLNSFDRVLSSLVIVFELGKYGLGNSVMFGGQNIITWFCSLTIVLFRSQQNAGTWMGIACCERCRSFLVNNVGLVVYGPTVKVSLVEWNSCPPKITKVEEFLYFRVANAINGEV